MEAEAPNNRRRVEQDSDEPPASVDFISDLPDDMLRIIISRLPTKCAVWTTVLTKQWCPLWHSALLNLTVDADLSVQEAKRVDAVFDILAAHHGPARRLSIGLLSSECKNLDMIFEIWFRSSALDLLEQLTFNGGTLDGRALPACALPHFAPTLQILQLLYSHIPEIHFAELLFPRLKILYLTEVCISQTAVKCILASSIALRDLQLKGIHGFESLCIVPQSLRTIGIKELLPQRSYLDLKELVIQDAPCLEILVVISGVQKISVVVRKAPKLRVLGYLPTGCKLFRVGILALQHHQERFQIIQEHELNMKFFLLKSTSTDLSNLYIITAYLKKWSRSSEGRQQIQSEAKSGMANVLTYSSVNPMETMYSILDTPPNMEEPSKAQPLLYVTGKDDVASPGEG